MNDIRSRVGRVGVWHFQTPPIQLAQALERLGYTTLWLGASPSGDLQAAETLLEATTSLRVATGIVNIWMSDAHEVARSYARLEHRYPGRFVLGLGVGHRENSREYHSPYDSLSSYTDTVLAGGVPAERVVLAALGPRVLRLAAEKTAGAHPYLVPPDHTRMARQVIGPAPLLAPEQKVILEADVERARAIARHTLARYLRLSNYLNSFRRLGWDDGAFAGGGSDALVDALVAHGSVDAIAERVQAHFDAGADHVAVQLLPLDHEDAVGAFTTLAAALEL